MDKLKKVLRREKDEKTEEDDIIEVTRCYFLKFATFYQLNEISH